jgi:hypothetical protein
MKSSALLLPVVFMLIACVAPPGGTTRYRTPSSRSNHSAYANRVDTNPYSMGGTSAANPPIKPGETSSAYRDRLARQQRERVPDAEVLYQSTERDFFGRRIDTGIYRSTGGVTEEVHIGNQQIPNNYNGLAPAYPNVYQGGHVPPRTGGIYDPYTGRVLPVRRP